MFFFLPSTTPAFAPDTSLPSESQNRIDVGAKVEVAKMTEKLWQIFQ